MKNGKVTWAVSLTLIFTITFLFVGLASADNGERRHRNRGFFHKDAYPKRDFAPVENQTYAEQCGACHFPYLPELLPAGSWRKILSQMENHNGVEALIEAGAVKTIAQYLESNAADNSGSRRAAKILRSLKGQTPTRITEIPYIQRKHHDVPIEVFQRKSIGSFSNCTACHTAADQGVFDDDYVNIPE